MTRLSRHPGYPGFRRAVVAHRVSQYRRRQGDSLGRVVADATADAREAWALMHPAPEPRAPLAPWRCQVRLHAWKRTGWRGTPDGQAVLMYRCPGCGATKEVQEVQRDRGA